jgi:hypothetical protein
VYTSLCFLCSRLSVHPSGQRLLRFGVCWRARLKRRTLRLAHIVFIFFVTIFGRPSRLRAGKKTERLPIPGLPEKEPCLRSFSICRLGEFWSVAKRTRPTTVSLPPFKPPHSASPLGRCWMLSSLCGDGTSRSRVPRLLRNGRGRRSYWRPGRLPWRANKLCVFVGRKRRIRCGENIFANTTFTAIYFPWKGTLPWEFLRHPHVGRLQKGSSATGLLRRARTMMKGGKIWIDALAPESADSER